MKLGKSCLCFRSRSIPVSQESGMFGNLSGMQIFRPQPRPTELKSVGMGPSSVFEQALQAVLMHTRV